MNVFKKLRAFIKKKSPNKNVKHGSLIQSFSINDFSVINVFPKDVLDWKIVLLIVQQLMRHGEKVMYIDEDNKKEVTVAEYVASDLGIDELAFTTPLFNEILQELLQHLGQPDFTAEHHFIAHANPALSRLAVDLIEEKYQLSKYHSKTQTILSDADRLTDIIPHLMTDYKHSLIEIELKETLNQLRQPDVMADPDKCVETMVRYKELMEIKQQMAKHLGDRVIG